MLIDYSTVENIYIVCGKTDMRRGVDGLASIVLNQFKLDVYSDSLFLFCGNSLNKFKALYWDGDGFVLLYKRFENGRLQWPRKEAEVRLLTQQQLRWLLEGLQVDQTKKISSAIPGYLS